jgi:hypothetical protein
MLYTILELVIVYITVKCSLINKCVHIFKLCCVPREGCVQYFNNCFNNNVINRNPTTTQQHGVTVTQVSTDSDETFQRIGREDYNRNSENRRSLS